MKSFARYRYVAVLLSAAFMLQGCDWIKGMMGMPTSEDIARMKLELQLDSQRAEEAAREQRIKDSLAQAEIEAARMNVVEGYYVVLGSFKDYGNAEALAELVKKNGFAAKQIMLKNGLKMVAVGGFQSFGEAAKELERIGEKDFCPYDLWVYASTQGLHEENVQ